MIEQKFAGVDAAVGEGADENDGAQSGVEPGQSPPLRLAAHAPMRQDENFMENPEHAHRIAKQSGHAGGREHGVFGPPPAGDLVGDGAPCALVGFGQFLHVPLQWRIHRANASFETPQYHLWPTRRAEVETM
jgi:hypothetical protein